MDQAMKKAHWRTNVELVCPAIDVSRSCILSALIVCAIYFFSEAERAQNKHEGAFLFVVFW